MDYNDINLRLKRLYLSIDQQYEDNFLDHMQIRTENKEDGQFKLVLDFNANNNESETTNKINSIVSNLANLKDHLINKLELKGGNAQDIENEINLSLPLQLILDLNNQEKHGYPLSKIRRSMKDPKIIDIKKAASSKPGTRSSEFVIDPITGAGHTNNMVVVITARVVDGQNNFLYYLGDLIKKSLLSWEEIIIKFSLH